MFYVCTNVMKLLGVRQRCPSPIDQKGKKKKKKLRLLLGHDQDLSSILDDIIMCMHFIFFMSYMAFSDILENTIHMCI